MSINPRQTSVLIVAAVTALSWLVPKAATAQTKGCEPVAERAGREFGCFITAREELGPLPGHSSFYWHIDAFTTRAAAETARARRSTVVESLGSLWLFAIAEAAWRPATGERIASVGPLPLVKADAYAAVYMEGVFRPGMRSPIHRHPGGEAWYTLEGEQCLETPRGKLVQRAGGAGVTVPAGLPMMLTGTGSGPRRSLVLILQDAAQPRSTLPTDWAPAGLCRS
jgi:quercetin dioxygenase-like cupin family protein